jgi:hypothetical protein
MNNEDRLSKKGINLIFSKIKEGDNNVFSPRQRRAGAPLRKRFKY